MDVNDSTCNTYSTHCCNGMCTARHVQQAYLQVRWPEVAQGHCAVHKLCEAEGRHGRGPCHTSPDQSLHLICAFDVESQVGLRGDEGRLSQLISSERVKLPNTGGEACQG